MTMKNLQYLLTIAAVGGQFASARTLDKRAGTPTPYQPSGCLYTNVTGQAPCNNQGSLKKPAHLGAARIVPSENGCVDLCFSMTTCHSFVYTPSSKKCQLYSKTLGSQEFSAGTTGPFYSNRACYKRECSCNNVGLNWGLFEDYTTDDSSSSTYDATWDPVAVTGPGGNLFAQGTVDTIGFSGRPGRMIHLYRQHEYPPMRTNDFAVSHTFYVQAAYTGTYNIDAYNVDDIVDIWTGSEAYSGWNRSNAAYEGALDTSNGTTFDATAGEYTPIRIVYGQGDGDYKFMLKITDPQGNDILDYSYGPYKTIKKFSCDMTTAPPFPAFD